MDRTRLGQWLIHCKRRLKQEELSRFRRIGEMSRLGRVRT
jgi:hypothetical protein